ncbi:MAG: hypothetical protein R3D68_02090 [Hyphomicrobiaceae bacterium]
MRSRLWPTMCLLALLAGAWGCGVSAAQTADQQSPPAVPVLPGAAAPAPGSLEAYLKDRPACTRVANGCETCVRDASGHARCSTPGIACQPGQWACNGDSARATDSRPREETPGP